MQKLSRSLAVFLVAVAVFVACSKEKSESGDQGTFAFVVYPGAKYLPQITDLFKRAHKTLKPTEEPPPIAVYDTDATVEDVAKYYAKSYGYGDVAADATNNLSAAKPAAFYRTGDLSNDAKAAEALFKQLNVPADVTKAAGAYKAAEIEAKPNRPHVTVQRPYFDPTQSAVVDRTLILMSRQQ
jgi:hypothetical protein